MDCKVDWTRFWKRNSLPLEIKPTMYPNHNTDELYGLW